MSDPLESTSDELASRGRFGSGGHFQLAHVTNDLVNKMHEAGKIVAVWVDTNEDYEEDEEFYKLVYDLNVDMLTTDHPERAHRALQAHHESKMAKSLMSIAYA